MPNADHRVALPVGERQYHIDLGPGELAEYILLPGDPDRTARIATRLDSIEFERRNREFASVTGSYKGLRVSIVSTGIGTDNMEIVVAEMLAITEHPTFIRVGSSGALQPRDRPRRPRHHGRGRSPGDDHELVRPRTATPRSPITRRSAPSSRPPTASGHRYHVGITATAPGFFGAQGRPIPQLPIRYPDLAEDMARQRVMNFEMEASALLVLAGLARCRAGAVCAVFAQRVTGDFVVGAAKDAAEAACVETGLESLRILADMDRRKVEAGTDRWRPSLGI